jgi:hypothetical protein
MYVLTGLLTSQINASVHLVGRGRWNYERLLPAYSGGTALDFHQLPEHQNIQKVAHF